MLDIGLCQPSTAILLVSVAGVIYHLFAGDIHSITWWLLVGLVGTGVFQALCFGGLEPVAWVLMSIPVLIVCFFLAVALFASRMRIQNVRQVPCDRCGNPKPRCGCDSGSGKKPRCNRTRCNRCSGCGCDHCLTGEEENIPVYNPPAEMRSHLENNGYTESE
jgi:hypothetical protein